MTKELIELGLLVAGGAALGYMYLRSATPASDPGATDTQQASGSFAVPTDTFGSATTPSAMLNYNYPIGAPITIPELGTFDGGAPLLQVPPVTISLGGTNVYAPNNLTGGSVTGSNFGGGSGCGGCCSLPSNSGNAYATAQQVLDALANSIYSYPSANYGTQIGP